MILQKAPVWKYILHPDEMNNSFPLLHFHRRDWIQRTFDIQTARKTELSHTLPKLIHRYQAIGVPEIIFDITAKIIQDRLKFHSSCLLTHFPSSLTLTFRVFRKCIFGNCDLDWFISEAEFHLALQKAKDFAGKGIRQDRTKFIRNGSKMKCCSSVRASVPNVRFSLEVC